MENQAYAAGVNRIGREGAVEYSGDSCIVGPMGNVILDCGAEEGIFTAEADPDEPERIRKQFPFIGDRRVFPAA